jgi:hypothetical protein
MPTLNGIYWENRYQQGDTGWDIGSASTPIISYCQQLPNKNLRILIPGCGNAHEVETLLNLGFTNITVLDFAESPLKNIAARNSLALEQGKLQLVCDDFFAHKGEYDLILEQTFFCAIHPSQRPDYAKHMHALLVQTGTLAGLLFNFELTQAGPPFGGSLQNYEEIFAPYFTIKTLEPCYNSIKPRLNRELFFILQK